MQGTLPVKVARATRRRWSRRRYFALGLVLLAAATSIAVALFRPFDAGPRKPSPEIVKLAETYMYLHTLPNAFDPLAWSPDGVHLATVVEDKLLVHDLSGERPRDVSVPLDASSMLPNTTTPSKMMWSPDSKVLALDEAYGGVPHRITLVDAQRGKKLHAVRVPFPPERPGISPGGSEPVLEPGGHMLLGWADNGRSLVSLLSKAPQVRRREGSPTDSPTFELIDPEADPTIEVYCYVLDIATGELVRSVQIYSSTLLPLPVGVALSPDGDTLAFAWRSAIDSPESTKIPLNLDLWDLRSSKLKTSVTGLLAGAENPYPRTPGQYVAWSPDGATLYIASAGTVKVIDAATGRIVRTLPDTVPPTGTPMPTATTPPTLLPGAVSTAGLGGGAQPGAPSLRWPDIFGGLLPQPTPAALVSPTPTPDASRYDPIVGISLSPSGDRLAVFDLRVIRLWNLASGNLEMLTSVPDAQPDSRPMIGAGPQVEWPADGRILASYLHDFAATIWLIDPETGGHLRRLSSDAGYMYWSPATNMVALQTRASLEIWGLDNGPAATVNPKGSPTP